MASSQWLRTEVAIAYDALKADRTGAKSFKQLRTLLTRTRDNLIHGLSRRASEQD